MEVDIIERVIHWRATTCSYKGGAHDFIFFKVSLAPFNSALVLLTLPKLVEERRPQDSDQHIKRIEYDDCVI